MTFKKLLLAASVVQLFAGTAALAQNTSAPTSTDLVRITRVDANGDGTPGAVTVPRLFDNVGVGYTTGGAVTQITSRTTGVTINALSGQITLVSAAGSATAASFTVTNNKVAAGDVVLLSQKSGTDLYVLNVTATAAGSFRVTQNTTGGTTTEAPVITFAVIKAAAS